MGQTDFTVDGTVVPIDAMTSTDDNGAFTFAVNTTGLPDGNYSVVAHGLNSRTEQVFTFTISGTVSTQSPLTVEGSTSVAAGTLLTIHGMSYQADEPVNFWINVPSGTTISNASLGQTDTTIDGTVIPLDVLTSTDDFGAFTYTLNTAGLPSGSYSLVAHGLNSKMDNVLKFTIQ